jgi:voltage-gated potassium channel
MTSVDSNTPQLARERTRLLARFRRWTELPLLVLGFVWLVLLVIELTSMRALGTGMGRRGLGYVAALTFVVIIAGAAGMLALEREAAGGLPHYASALWFTIMLLTTIGSEYWPRTPEGRLLCILLSMYAIGVFGYITAGLASFFVERDREEQAPERLIGSDVDGLRLEIAALRDELRGRRP